MRTGKRVFRSLLLALLWVTGMPVYTDDPKKPKTYYKDWLYIVK